MTCAEQIGLAFLGGMVAVPVALVCFIYFDLFCDWLHSQPWKSYERKALESWRRNMRGA